MAPSMGMVMNYIMTALNYLVRIIRPSTFFILRACLAQLLRQLHMKLCQTVIFGQASRLKPSTKLLRASTGGVKPQIVASDGFTSTSRRPWQKCPLSASAQEREEGAELLPAPRRSGRRGRRGLRLRGGAGGGAPLARRSPARLRWRR